MESSVSPSSISIDSIPFLLAPSSRPPSPLLSHSNSIILSRLNQQTKARSKTITGVGGNEGLGLILPPLLSIGIKGRFKDGRSPWSSNWQYEEEEGDKMESGPWEEGLPNDLEQWGEWEKLRKEKRKRKGKEVEIVPSESKSSNSSSSTVGSKKKRTVASPDLFLANSSNNNINKKGSKSGILEGRGFSPHEVVRTSQSTSSSSNGKEKGVSLLGVHQSLPTLLPSSSSSSTSTRLQTEDRQMTITSSVNLIHTKPFATGINFKKTSTPNPSQIQPLPLPFLTGPSMVRKLPSPSPPSLSLSSAKFVEEVHQDWVWNDKGKEKETGKFEDEFINEVGNSEFILDPYSSNPLSSTLPLPIPSIQLHTLLPPPPLLMDIDLDILLPSPPINTSTPTLTTTTTTATGSRNFLSIAELPDLFSFEGEAAEEGERGGEGGEGKEVEKAKLLLSEVRSREGTGNTQDAIEILELEEGIEKFIGEDVEDVEG